MLPRRQEINEYSRSCERLIFAGVSPGANTVDVKKFSGSVTYSKELTRMVKSTLAASSPLPRT
jgi:Cft2 family RNA processing exonuclease